MIYDVAVPMNLSFRAHTGSLITSRIDVSRDVKHSTDGPKPKPPLPERPYLRQKLRIQPFTGRLMQFQNEYDFIVWEGSCLNQNFNMGQVPGSYNPNLSLVLESPYCRYDGSLPAVLINPDLLSQCETRCMNALRSKSGQDNLDFGTLYAERHETVDLFRKLAKGALNLATAVKHGRIGDTVEVLRDSFGVVTSYAREGKRLRKLQQSVADTLQKQAGIASSRRGIKPSQALVSVGENMANAYLEYNLGVAPTASMFDDAYRRLLTGDLTAKSQIKARSRYGKNPLPWVDSSTINHFRGQVKIERRGIVRDEYQVTIFATPIDSIEADMARLGLTNGAYASWQGFGGSFIIDHWIAVGDYLQVLTIPREFEFNKGSWSRRVHDFIHVDVSSPSGKLTAEAQFKHFERKVYEDFPVPIFPLSLRAKDLEDKQIVTESLIALTKVKTVFRDSAKATDENISQAIWHATR